MSISIGLLSDPHATAEPLIEALSLFKDKGVDRVLCGGDIAGYGNQLDETIRLLQQGGCECVVGNHDLWYLERHSAPSPLAAHYLQQLPTHLALTLEGLSIYLVHAAPPDANRGGIKLRDKQGEIDPTAVAVWSTRLRDCGYDLLLVGHTHQIFAERLGNTLVVNPGSCSFNHSCAIITLPGMQIEWFALSGRTLTPVWNWGMNEVKGVAWPEDGHSTHGLQTKQTKPRPIQGG